MPKLWGFVAALKSVWKTMSSKFNNDLVPASWHRAIQGPEVTALFCSQCTLLLFSWVPSQLFRVSCIVEGNISSKCCLSLTDRDWMGNSQHIAGISSSTWKRQHQESCRGASGLAEHREAAHPRWETQNKLSKEDQYWRSSIGLSWGFRSPAFFQPSVQQAQNKTGPS